MEDLENLLTEAKPPEPAQWPSGAARGIARVKYTHDAMIDLIISNPAISQNLLAAHFGYTASWISQVINSDAFQARLAERRGELVDPTLLASIEEQFKGVVARSLEVIREKLDNPAALIPNNLALRALELSARAAGYGARESTPPVSPVSVTVHLNEMGERLTELLRSKRQLIEGEIVNDNP